MFTRMTNRFGAETTTDKVLDGVDLRGRHILVTGVSAGLGVETARVLVARGAVVVGTARDLDKATHANTATLSASGGRGGRLSLIELDLASLDSVRACAADLLAAGHAFDAVIANAGVMATPWSQTADGFETQFGVNHLGHFVLINRIVPLMKAQSRVVALSSAGHRIADVDLDDPFFEKGGYNPWVAYGRSKTANILFAVELDRRHKGRGIRSTAVHPGRVRTELLRHVTPEIGQDLAAALGEGPTAEQPLEIGYKTVEQGAATSVWAAMVAPSDDIGARYCQDCAVADVEDSPGLGNGVRSYALGQARAAALWSRSEQLVDERF